MKLSDFDYELPASLIAKRPLAERDASRLLYLPATGKSTDHTIRELPRFVRPGDVWVINDTKVLPARLLGRKESGGAAEILLLETAGAAHVWRAWGRANKPLRCGHRKDGRMPPYIDRPETEEDRRRYQTVFARHAGAVAAPTAGLHLTQALMRGMRAVGARFEPITLHVGPGTFPLTIEVIPMARAFVAKDVAGLGGKPLLREGFVPDNGNIILVVHGLSFTDPPALEDELNSVPGVVTNGILAHQKADLVLMGTPGSVETIDGIAGTGAERGYVSRWHGVCWTETGRRA